MSLRPRPRKWGPTLPVRGAVPGDTVGSRSHLYDYPPNGQIVLKFPAQPHAPASLLTSYSKSVARVVPCLWWRTKRLPGLTTSHKYNSLHNSDRTSLTVATRWSVGHSANKARSCAAFSCVTGIIMDTVSIVHPNISIRVSHDVVFSEANKVGLSPEQTR